jgi:hypothetical protein
LVFISRRKGLQELLKNALEILEKEKEKEVFSILNFRPEGPASLACYFSQSRSLVSRSAPSGREPSFSPARRVVGRPNHPQPKPPRPPSFSLCR